MELIGIKLIFIVLLINCLTTIIGWMTNKKIDRSALYCGLVGYSSDEPANLDKLKILMMYNIARGEDGCGISIDNKLYKGVASKANFFEFIQSETLPVPTSGINIGHTRKSTSGTKTKECTHPFAFCNLDTKETYAIGAHNGFIKNLPELKKKYGYDNKEYLVDSMYLLNGVMDAKVHPEKVKILNDYEGFAALLWYFVGEDILYVFRGKSENGEDTTGERPLFYWQVKGKNQVYISSIKESLMNICDDEDKVIIPFDTNVIYAIDKGVISRLKVKITREGADSVVKSYSTINISKPKPIKEVFKGLPDKVYEKNKDKEKDLSYDNWDWFLENEPYHNPFKNGKIVYTQGKYHMEGLVLGADLRTGTEITLDNNGIKKGMKDYDEKSGKLYYFWNGWVVSSDEALKEITTEYNKPYPTIAYQAGGFWETAERRKNGFIYLLEFLRRRCIGVVFNNRVTGGYYTIATGDPKAHISYASGSWSPMFNQGKKYHFSNGAFKFMEYVKPGSEEVISLPASTVSLQPTNDTVDDDQLAISVLVDTQQHMEEGIKELQDFIVDSHNANSTDTVAYKSLEALKSTNEKLKLEITAIEETEAVLAD